MKSRWSNILAQKIIHDPLALRVYTSRLLGQETDLVLHGGGNTSVKTQIKNAFGEFEDVLYVKGSGWDLATIESAGFAPVRMDVLKKMARMRHCSDSEMVRIQRAAMTDPYAPNPSVEAILHAIIPCKFVDHTHADSVVAISNTPNGEKRIRGLYGPKALIIPYVMPGFILAKKIYEMTKDLDWNRYDAMILLHHGVFTFNDDARKSYEQMIRVVTKAENYLKKRAALRTIKTKPVFDSHALASIRQAVCKLKGSAVIAKLDNGAENIHFSNLSKVSAIATRGPLTPDHVIRTKRVPVILGKYPQKDIARFALDYQKYFKRNTTGQQDCLDAAPHWAVWPKNGTVAFAATLKDAHIISDIVEHTIRSIQQAEKLGGWRALSEKDMFDMEYWELEQAKLKRNGKSLMFQGKAALVTGAASGIGKACVETLSSLGACVIALDVNPDIKKIFNSKNILTMVCDLTKEAGIEKSIEAGVRAFGGLDILVSNAGTFPASEKIRDLKSTTWDKSMAINLTSHERLLKRCIPFLSKGIDPSVIMVASKNVPAPGPGVSAYSVAKAGLTQLARVAALELAPLGIRVNVIHPNQVFDTAIWTKDVLKERAKHYKMSVEEYKKSNLLGVAITSHDVARLIASLAGPVFSKTTGAQIPIDGGNDRVI